MAYKDVFEDPRREPHFFDEIVERCVDSLNLAATTEEQTEDTRIKVSTALAESA